jgi:hypothetical protein
MESAKSGCSSRADALFLRGDGEKIAAPKQAMSEVVYLIVGFECNSSLP